MFIDYSPIGNPTNANGTLNLDLNGLFAAGSPADKALSYVDYPMERLSQEAIEEVMNHDMVGVMRLETLQSLFDVAWEKNLTFDLKTFKVWQNGADNSTCDDIKDWLPNLDLDLSCSAGTDVHGTHWMIDYEYKIVNKPPKIVLTDDNLYMSGLDLQFHAWKLFADGTNKTLMNFIIGNVTFTANQTMQDDMSLNSDVTIEFNNATILERGMLVKSDRDVYRISNRFEDLKNHYNDNFDGHREAYRFNTKMHNWGYKIDAKN